MPDKPRRHPPQCRLTTRSVRLAPWVGKLGPRWGHKYILPHNLWRRPHRPNRSPRPAHNKHHTYAHSLRNHLQCGHPLLHTRGCKVGHGCSPRTPPTRSIGNTKMPAKAEPATAQGTRDSTAQLGRNIGGATADGRYEGGPGSKTPPPHHESSDTSQDVWELGIPFAPPPPATNHRDCKLGQNRRRPRHPHRKNRSHDGCSNPAHIASEERITEQIASCAGGECRDEASRQSGNMR